MDIIFDSEKLNKADRKIYEAMTDTEKANFERIWIMLETQKSKLEQQKNHSRLRAQREKKVLAEKERKARTHRLIERGAILESLIPDPEAFTNDEIMNLLRLSLNTEAARNYLQARNNEHSQDLREG